MALVKTLEVFRSVLLGVALGDAFGLHYELAGIPPRAEWVEEWVEPLTVEVPGGRIAYSDDTELTLILAETIIESCGFNPEVFARLLAEKADIWNPIRYYGSTALVIDMIRSGTPWREAARGMYNGQGNYGNGAAIRVAPIPLFYDSKESVELMSIAQSMVTHTHPLGAEAARIQALALYYALHNEPPERTIELLLEDRPAEEIRRRIEMIPSLLDKSPVEVAHSIGNSAIGFESVPAALLVYVRSRGNARKAVWYSISLGGDTDSIASMAVALTAAYNKGVKGLEEYAERLEDYELIVETAERLYKSYQDCRRASEET